MRLFYLSVFLVFLFLGLSSGSLGISPAKQILDFVPGQVHKFTYSVSTDNPGAFIKIYFDGDLAPYAVASQEFLVGGGSFEVTINMPQKIDIPGEHSLYVRAIEDAPDGQFLGSRIDIGSLVRVLVPYPGEYAFLSMNLPDGNVGEKIKISLKIENKGTDSLEINTAFIELFNSGKLVETIDLETLVIETTKEHIYESFLDVKNFPSGEYLASAVIKSPSTWAINDTFRLGSQFLNITYFTTNVSAGDIHPFYINVQSLWNNDIKGVFADVNLTNSSGGTASSFRTPSFNFLAWEQKVISGFIDVRELNGKYDALVELNYGGKITTASGSFFVEDDSYLLMAVIIIVSLIVLFILYKIISRKKK
jgi:hypothetical protein